MMDFTSNQSSFLNDEMQQINHAMDLPARDQEYWDWYGTEITQHVFDTRRETLLLSDLPILPCASLLPLDLCPSAVPAFDPRHSHLQISQDKAQFLDSNTTYRHHCLPTYCAMCNAISNSPPLRFPTPLPDWSCAQLFPLGAKMVHRSTNPPFQTLEGIIPAHIVDLEDQDVDADCGMADAFEGMGFGLAGWIAMKCESTMDVGLAGIWAREGSVLKTNKSDIDCDAEEETVFKEWPILCPRSSSSFSSPPRPMFPAGNNMYVVHKPDTTMDGGRSLTTRKRKREMFSSNQSIYGERRLVNDLQFIKREY